MHFGFSQSELDNVVLSAIKLLPFENCIHQILCTITERKDTSRYMLRWAINCT